MFGTVFMPQNQGHVSKNENLGPKMGHLCGKGSLDMVIRMPFFINISIFPRRVLYPDLWKGAKYVFFLCVSVSSTERSDAVGFKDSPSII